MKTKFTSRIPWREKMERPQEPKLVPIPPKMLRFGFEERQFFLK